MSNPKTYIVQYFKNVGKIVPKKEHPDYNVPNVGLIAVTAFTVEDAIEYAKSAGYKAFRVIQ